MKPIIASALKGVLIDPRAWTQAHRGWYEQAAKELGDDSVLQWIGRKDYWKGVDEVMLRLMPDATKEERETVARERYFASVLEYIRLNDVVNQEAIERFVAFKERFRLGLITTNTYDALAKILTAAKLENFYDIIEAEEVSDRDDAVGVFERFVDKHGKPAIYFGASEKSLEICEEKGIEAVYVNLYGGGRLSDMQHVSRTEEFTQVVSRLVSD